MFQHMEIKPIKPDQAGRQDASPLRRRRP